MDICGKKSGLCVCTLGKEVCDGRHLCMNDGCGGSWKGLVLMLLPSTSMWPQHIEISESLLNLDPGSAEIAMLLMRGM